MKEQGPSCPVSGQMVHSKAAQINALVVALFIAIALVTQSPWPVLILLIDFGIKIFVGFRASPISAFARWAVKTFKIKGEMMDVAPKKFAASMGFGFAAAGLVCAAFGLWAAFAVVLGTCGMCALVEGLFGLCVGCRIYLLLPATMRSGDRRRAEGTV
jgi:hypothetical protein